MRPPTLRRLLLAAAALGAAALAACGGGGEAGPTPEEISIRLASESAAAPHVLVSDWCLRELGEREAALGAAIADAEAGAKKTGSLRAEIVSRLTRLFVGYDRQLRACLAEETQEFWNEQRRLRELESGLAGVSTRLVGRPAEVTCETRRFWELLGAPELLGYVFRGETEIHLAPRVCYALHRFRYVEPGLDLGCLARARKADLPLCGPEQELLVQAVTTVAHELQHARGITREDVAECYGLQVAARVGRSLGLPAATAHLAAFYTWRFSFAPPHYRSRECRPGGALDRRPATKRWP